MDDNQRWEYAISVILSHEGGLSDHKRDPGGVTKWGISLRFLRAIGVDVNQDGKVDREDILCLTKPNAKSLYKRFWWDKYRYNDIHSLIVATKVFDLAVNMGSSQSHKLLQISINRILNKSIAVDGILGIVTRSYANMIKESHMMVELRKNAAHFYTELIANKPELKVFEKGWLRRAAW